MSVRAHIDVWLYVYRLPLCFSACVHFGKECCGSCRKNRAKIYRRVNVHASACECASIPDNVCVCMRLFDYKKKKVELDKKENIRVLAGAFVHVRTCTS